MMRPVSLSSALLLSALLVVGVAAAAPKKLPAYSSLGVTSGKAGGNYTLALGDSPQSFMYYGVIDNNLGLVAQQLFDGLVEFNLDTYKIDPALAESWTVRPTAARSTPSSCARASSGATARRLTPTTWSLLTSSSFANPEARAGDAGNFVMNGKPVDDREGGRLHRALYFAAASPAFLFQQRYFIMPQHKFGKVKGAAVNNVWPSNTPPAEIVGTGPFRLPSYTAGQKVGPHPKPQFLESGRRGHQAAVPEFGGIPDYSRSAGAGGVVPGGERRSAQRHRCAVSRSQAEGSGGRGLQGHSQQRAVRQSAVCGLQLRCRRCGPRQGVLRRPLPAGHAEGHQPRPHHRYRVQRPGQPAGSRRRAGQQDCYVKTTAQLGKFDIAAAGKALDALGIKDTDGDGIRKSARARIWNSI